MKKKRSFIRNMLIAVAIVVAVGAAYRFFIPPQIMGVCPTLRLISSLMSISPVISDEVSNEDLGYGVLVYPKKDIAKLEQLGAVRLCRVTISFIENSSQVTQLGIIGIDSAGDPMNQPEDPTVPPIPPIPGCPDDCKCPENERVDYKDAKDYLKELIRLKTITQ